MTDEKSEAPEEIRFDYIKGNHYRVVHADGVFGGITHRGLIWATIYSERGAIPVQVTYPVTPERKLGPELMKKRSVRDATIREVECSLMMDLNLARSLRGWLDEKIGTLESKMAESAQASDGDRGNK